VIGGIALGIAVRHAIRGHFSCNMPFNVVWGLIFGGAPLFIGYGDFATHGAMLFFLIEVAIFVGAIVITAIIPGWFVESFNVPTIMPIAVGGLFLLIGIGIGIALAVENEPLYAIIFFGAFSGAGGLVFISGLHTLLTQK
jgi:hypothetical protein